MSNTPIDETAVLYETMANGIVEHDPDLAKLTELRTEYFALEKAYQRKTAEESVEFLEQQQKETMDKIRTTKEQYRSHVEYNDKLITELQLLRQQLNLAQQRHDTTVDEMLRFKDKIASQEADMHAIVIKLDNARRVREGLCPAAPKPCNNRSNNEKPVLQNMDKPVLNNPGLMINDMDKG